MKTYNELTEMFAKARKGKVKLENNTYLYQKTINGVLAFEIVLHETAVVTVFPNNTFRLNTGGWATVTTKARLNAYSPARVYSEKGIWKVGKGELYQDGMVVGIDGAKFKMIKVA